MPTAVVSLAEAVAHHKAGRLEEASREYLQVLEAEPGNFEAWYFSGLLARRLGDHSLAIDRIRRAIQLRPESAEAHCSLGITQQCLGMFKEAIASYLESLDRFPQNARACFCLGDALRQSGNSNEAIVYYRRAIRLNPHHADAHHSLGNVLRSQGLLSEAVECFERASELRPDSVQVLTNLADALREHGELDRSLACYLHALQRKPDFVPGYLGLGTAYQDLDLPDKAIECFEQALSLQPNNAVAWCSLGNMLKEQGRATNAIGCFRRALQEDPDLDCASSNLLCTTYFSPDYDAARICEEHRIWNERRAASCAPAVKDHANDPSPDRTLRIGYVSPNFRNHCQSLFTVPLLARHDHQQFEVFCYSLSRVEDEYTGLIRSYADQWRDIGARGEDEACTLIRQDRIDVLVDLTMHMAENRWPLFAKKPAPVQVCWLAYPGTTGLTTIDYRLTDPHLDPPGMFDRFYSERSIRLDDSFWCYDPLSSEPAVNALPAQQNGYVTFGSLNNFCKVNANVLQLWARVMRAVDGSRLVLRAAEGYQQQFVLSALHEGGISADRVTFVGRRPRQKYLELFHEIDVCLDTLPANGHTTSLDSLWMGVPVVTLVGETAVGRGGLSILSNLQLLQFIAQTPEDFVRIARQTARDVHALRALRSSLRDRMERSPLMDAPGFARKVEAAYRAMWRQWCAECG